MYLCDGKIGKEYQVMDMNLPVNLIFVYGKIFSQNRDGNFICDRF